MAERSKAHLKQEFRDGERPTGKDFEDLIDSFVCKTDDAVTVDALTHNLNIPGGINLADTAQGKAGTLRFNSGQVQVHNGATWGAISGGNEVFQQINNTPNVGYSAGNVGINVGNVAPTARLEVRFNTVAPTAIDLAKFGNAAVANGASGFTDFAVFGHATHVVQANNYALRQGPNGDVSINAPSTQNISFTHSRLSNRMTLHTSGAVLVNTNALLPGSIMNDVNGNNHMLQVSGHAAKTRGGGTWADLSDFRAKQDIRNLEDGLEKLMKVRTVRYRYNGKYNTSTDHEEFGIIGQEIREIFPYMVSTGKAIDEVTGKEDDVVMFNASPLTFVMVNAIQELTNRVQELEKRLSALEGK
ncbi:tail fiber domain-containing protein [Chitinophaga caseinilytica]|uniref:Tail fiber domain-containing protein n=1 Tax=Chitinophaga caseinilytica TaxID=2267521 RepID=A0ABZ2Z495_9BACT